jgi:hypothetical protein
MGRKESSGGEPLDFRFDVLQEEWIGVEPASAKADLSPKSNGFVVLYRPDGSHAQIGMRANALGASTTCTFLSVWGVPMWECSGCLHLSPVLSYRSEKPLDRINGLAYRCKPLAFSYGVW